MRDFLPAVFLLHLRDAPCCPPLSLNSTAPSRRRRGGSLVLRKKQKVYFSPLFSQIQLGKKVKTQICIQIFQRNSLEMRSEKIWSIWLLRALRCGKMHFRAFCKQSFLICFVVGSRSSWIFFSSPLESQICIVKVQLSFTQRRRQSFKETEEHTPSHIHERKKRKEILFPACRSAGPRNFRNQFVKTRCVVSNFGHAYTVHTLGG